MTVNELNFKHYNSKKFHDFHIKEADRQKLISCYELQQVDATNSKESVLT